MGRSRQGTPRRSRRAKSTTSAPRTRMNARPSSQASNNASNKGKKISARPVSSRERRGSHLHESVRSRQRSHATTARKTSTPRERSATRRHATPRSGARKGRPFLPVIIIVVVAALIAEGLYVWHKADTAPTQVADHHSSIHTAVTDLDNLFTNPYAADDFVAGVKGHIAYQVNGKTLSRTGVDVSEHQGQIDWKAVKADGVDFAYIRTGFRGSDTGRISADSQFETNLEGARAAGLKIGVYFYSQATSTQEAREEAQFVLNKLDGQDIDYPVAFDMEPGDEEADRVSNLTSGQLSEIAKAFCEAIDAGGYSAVVYGNQYDLTLYDLHDLASYGFWYAEYSSFPNMSLRMALWQYSNSATVDGIKGKVDLNLDLTPALEQAYPEDASSSSSNSSSSSDASSSATANSSTDVSGSGA